jgi:hypothetical protein
LIQERIAILKCEKAGHKCNEYETASIFSSLKLNFISVFEREKKQIKIQKHIFFGETNHRVDVDRTVD